jgi:uncharacterized metal-binding protein YceD (DUF177 family)
MKARLSPLEIALKELPPEGREFNYTRETGELTEALKDLVGSNDYKVNFLLTPVGNAYNLKGTLETSLDQECSLCAIDFKFPIRQDLHEVLVVQKPLNKGDQQTKANHAHEWAASGPDYIILDSETFTVADYIHEAIALAEPIRPLGKPNCDITCENLTEPMKKWIVQPGASPPDPIKTNPFLVLEKIKLKS